MLQRVRAMQPTPRRNNDVHFRARPDLDALYLVARGVTGEIAVLPLTLNLPLLAAVFTILNAAVLAIRISAENRALAASRETMAPEPP